MEVVARASCRDPRFTRFINAYNTEDSVDMNGGCGGGGYTPRTSSPQSRIAPRAHGRTHGCRCCRPVQNYRRRVMDAKLGYVDVPMGFSHLCIIRLPANPLKVPIPIIKINCFHRPSAINQNLVRPVSVCSLVPVLVQTVRSQLIDGVASRVM